MFAATFVAELLTHWRQVVVKDLILGRDAQASAFRCLSFLYMPTEVFIQLRQSAV